MVSRSNVFTSNMRCFGLIQYKVIVIHRLSSFNIQPQLYLKIKRRKKTLSINTLNHIRRILIDQDLTIENWISIVNISWKETILKAFEWVSQWVCVCVFLLKVDSNWDNYHFSSFFCYYKRYQNELNFYSYLSISGLWNALNHFKFVGQMNFQFNNNNYYNVKETMRL